MLSSIMLNNRSEVEGQWSLFCVEFRSRMNMYGYNNHEKLCSEQYRGKYGASQPNSKIVQGVNCCWPFHSWDSERLQTFTGLIMIFFLSLLRLFIYFYWTYSIFASYSLRTGIILIHWYFILTKMEGFMRVLLLVLTWLHTRSVLLNYYFLHFDL